MYHDLKVVLRQLGRSPTFTIVAVLMLAFGIGATTVTFSVAYGILFRPLPFPNPDRLVTLGDQLSGTDWGTRDSGPITGPEAVIYSRDTHSFQALGAYGFMLFELGGAGEPAQINGARVTPSVFDALAVSPFLGRVFNAEEDAKKSAVVVLSYSTWRSRFNSDPTILGRTIQLSRKPWVVIGVMPPHFEFPLTPGRLNRTELWIPMSLSAKELSPAASSVWFLQMIGRLRPGVSLQEAQSDAQVVADQIMHDYPPEASSFHIHPAVYPLQQITVTEARPLLHVLSVAVFTVLLIACANFAGLLLIRVLQRRRDSAMRIALGSSTTALVSQSLLEGSVLSVSGGLLGAGLAAITLSIGKRALPETLPLVSNIVLDWRVLAFALALSILTGALCGLVPGIVAVRTNIDAVLKAGGRNGSSGGSHPRLRSALVIMEIAVAYMLLVTSTLLVRSFEKMRTVDLGFHPDHVVTAVYGLPKQQYGTQSAVDSFNSRLLEKLRSSPRAQAVGLTNRLPTTGSVIESFVAEGYNSPGNAPTTAAPSEVIGDFFAAMGVSLLNGRYFNEHDDADGQLVVIVNREFAQHYWPHQDPIGRRMRIGTPNSRTPWMSVVGIVSDARLNSPDSDASEQFYRPVAQLAKDEGARASGSPLNGRYNYIVMRSALPAEEMQAVLSRTVQSIDPQLPLSHQMTMDEAVSQSVAPRRFNTVTIGAFAFAAMLLAMLGIYSVVAFAVALRTQELAIRLALGSSRMSIMRIVLVSGLKLALVGSGLGLIGSIGVARFVQSLLFAVSPTDPWALALTTASIFALAIAASGFPARRAATSDPIVLLRQS